ncbi:MAG: energy-coupling factor transporter transmembrane protein EcfT [Methanoregula sp.]|jgi:energy-coupling factor transport system permease protein|nr:energy-coupling factor transporter transmembrane protein EcfT [Methanoregula sp.]
MRDIRLRTGTATILSVIAFYSITGAVAAFVWWLVFTPNLALVRKNRLVIPSIAMIAIFSIILELTGGAGLAYFFRMMVVILIGVWLLSGQTRGEFLHMGCWLLGNRIGFELGMLAEMGLQNLHALLIDFDRIRAAERMKGVRSGLQSIVPVGRVLVHGTLLRAEDTAELLAVRGYVQGGTCVVTFAREKGDIPAAFFAVCAALIAMIPVSAFFILS